MKLLIYKSTYINIKSAFARAMLMADLRTKRGPEIEVGEHIVMQMRAIFVPYSRCKYMCL